MPNTSLVATAAADGEVILWDTAASPIMKARLQHGTPVLAVAVSPDGKMLASGTQDGMVRLWSIPSSHWMGDFRAHHGPVTRVAFDPLDSQTVLSASNDWTVRVFRILPEHEKGISPDTILPQIEAETGVEVIIAASGEDASYSPPRPLEIGEWENRYRKSVPKVAPIRLSPEYKND